MKKVRDEIHFKGCGGLADAFDDAFKQSFNITDEEYNLLCEECTDEEMQCLLIDHKSTFSDKRKALLVRNKYVPYYQ